MDESVKEAVKQFIAVTGARESVAEFYLESCSWDVQEAVDKYFSEPVASPPPSDNDDETAAADIETNPVSAFSNRQPPVPAENSPFPINPNTSNSRIRGLGDLSQRDIDEEDSSGPEDNEYYTGGEKSGVTVKGGKKPDQVGGLFESAKKHGAVQGSESDLQPQRGGGGLGGSIRAFQGTARTLAGQQLETAAITRPSEPITITFYSNSIFTVDDGEPRAISDPTNAEFIKSISKGECPKELDTRDGRTITVNLVRKESEYKAPERPSYMAFEGQAQTLGTTSQNLFSVQGSGTDTRENNLVLTEWEGADESLPVTSIQLRLIDGSRLVARFNNCHRISDIRRFIEVSRPDLPRRCVLATAFPSKILEDDSKTIEDAGLANAVVIQKAA